MLTSTIRSSVVPEATEMHNSAEVRAWIEGVVTQTWQDAKCGDGRCEAPFEFPEYGRFGCKADCNILTATAQITPIQIDIYYNFSHPKGSVSPIDLMQDAKWNLCPLEVDEVIGPKKIYHGSDCYYEEDQGFEDQVGHHMVEIDDVPDGQWTIVVKKDIFLKVAGAVRPRLNVTKEATNKRLLLASHYGQIRRKWEVTKYEELKAHVTKTNLTRAHEYLDLDQARENQTLTDNANTDETYDVVGNLTALEDRFTLNRTMVNVSLTTNSVCQNNFASASYLNVSSTAPLTLDDETWPYTQDELVENCECRDAANKFNAVTDSLTHCYCFLPSGVSQPSSSQLADAEKIACTETMRWILTGSETSSWNWGLQRAWTMNAGLQDDAKLAADAEFNQVLDWLSSISPVTFFEINQIKGTDETKLAEASLDTLKEDNALSERAADPNAARVAEATRDEYPYYEQLVDLIDARLAIVDTDEMRLPLYLSPPEFPFNFTYMNEGGLEIANAKYPGFDLHVDVDLELVEWNPAVLEREEYAFMSCNLETRAEQYVGTCVKPEDVTTPLLTNPGTGAIEPYLQQPRYQRLCDAICYCSEAQTDSYGRIRFKNGCDVLAGPGHHCTCEMCERMEQFDNVIYPSNYTGIAGRRLLEEQEPRAPRDWSAPHRAHWDARGPTRRGARPGLGRRRLLQSQTDLDDILAAVQDLSTRQSNLDTKVDSVRTAQAVANQEAQQHHADTSLETIIRAGFDDLKRGTDSLSSSLDEILAKQQQALAAAQESRQIQERPNALAEAGLRQIEKLARAVEKQTESIHAAYASNAFTGVEQYVAVQENAVVTRERKAKENMLMNQPCQMKVMYYSFELDNFNNTVPPIAYRERFVGLNNRVVAGMLVYVERKNLIECPSNRFEAIDRTCSGGRDISSFGIDPVFKLGTPLYNADYDNYETITRVYNCSAYENADAGIYATYNDNSSATTHGNHYPFCQELFNGRDIPYGFRHKSIPGFEAGFPYFFDINLSADDAKRWIDVMNYGLMIDDVKTDKVTAQLVVYNAELGYFGNVMVFFQFTDGGKIEVTHSVNTIKVELYETADDFVRFAMEILLVIGIVWSVYEEVLDMFHTRREKGTYMAYFASVWNYIDVASITIHVVTVVMWFTFGWNLAAQFSPEIHYDIYKNIEASSFNTNLRVPNQMVELGSIFLEMKQLVDYLQTYMTLSGINIILMLLRILKLMDFQPRLGVITHTLALASPDLMHFFVIFITIFMGYAFIGHVIFGYTSSHFADMTASVNSLFQNLLGDITYFMEDFKSANGLNFAVGMIYFYSFNIFVLMILFNFLLAIICDAFGEVKANASESVSVTTELAPMMRDAWRNTFRSMYPSHVPEERVRRQLRIWMGENPDDSEEDEVEESADHIFKYDGEKEIDSAGLKRVLRRCVIETYQRTADAKFLLSQRGEGFLGRGKKNTRALATAEEIEAAAEMLLQQVGQEPEQADSDEDGPSEIEKLQESLEKLLKAQQRLVEGQVKVIEGQARMADRQERLSDLEKKILGVLNKAPDRT